MSVTDALRGRLAALNTDTLALEAPDAWAVLAGVLTLHVGAEMAYAREPSVYWGVASVYVFGSALVLVAAGVTDLDLRQWGAPLTLLAATSLLTAVGLTYLSIHGTPINTDALAFINQAGASILAGESPYRAGMATRGQFPTPMVMGGHVARYSYPAGSALLVAPFRAVARDGARVAVLFASAACAGVLLWTLPSQWAPAGLFGLLVGDFITWGVADLTDPLWVAPLLGAVALWPWTALGRASLRGSAVLFGLAMAIKQHPWFCAPFLFLWVWRARDIRAAGRFAALVAAVFGAIHLPFIVQAPEATLTGLFVNLIGGDGTLVHLGVGLSALTVSGAFPVAKWAHTALMIGVGVGGLAAYWRWFDEVQWLAWMAWAPILFMSYRSLANYFVVLGPVVVLVMVARRHKRRQEHVA